VRRDEAIAARRLALWVTQTNAPARALYTRMGFVATGRTQPVPSNPTLREEVMVRDL
jgi:hypothetical protein